MGEGSKTRAVLFFFFFKQKTAYEINECDWSSDVCSSDLSNLSTHGVTGGAGVEMRVRAMRLSPAVRYTHWGRDAIYDSGVRRNEAALLVGFSFGGSSL